MKKRFVVKDMFTDAWLIYDNKRDDWYRGRRAYWFESPKYYDSYKEARIECNKLNEKGVKVIIIGRR